MDDHMNVYDYVGDEKHEYSAATNVNKEEHEMLKLAPQKENQQAQVDHSSNDINVQEDRKDAKKAEKAGLIFTAMLLTTILLISLVAVVLSIVSYNASVSNKIQGENLCRVLVQDKLDILEFTLKQLNSTLLKQNGQQIGLKIINTSQLDEIDNYITSVATTVGTNISQLLTQIDAVSRFAISVQAEVIRIHCGAGE